MPFPVSRKQVDNIGQQLAATGFVCPERRELFSQILEYYQELLNNVAEQISRLSYEPTNRVKTTGTLIEKLKRENGIKLSRIQDVAGARIVVGALRTEQDQAVAEVYKNFAELGRKPLIVDRRADPRYGYRAVHVIVYPERVPVEIQVRTTLQDLWAQLFENLADQWGRQIRYGGPPEPVKTPELTPINRILPKAAYRGEILQILIQLSEIIAEYEEQITKLARLEQQLEEVSGIVTLHIERIAIELEESGPTTKIMTHIKEIYIWLRTGFIVTCKIMEQDKRRRNRIIRRNLPSCEQPEIFDLRNAAIRALLQAKKMVIDARLEAARQEGGLKYILADLTQVVGGGAADVELPDRV